MKSILNRLPLYWKDMACIRAKRTPHVFTLERELMTKVSVIRSILFAFGLFLSVPSVHAAEWGLSLGTHDMMVADIDTPEFNNGNSHTYGLNLGIFADQITESGILIQGNGEMFLDIDRDKLDPDHIPLWFKVRLLADGTLYSVNRLFGFHWLVDVRAKQNTVSGIENDMKQFIGVGLAYDNGTVNLALNGYGGFYYLEIDDDVPFTYGYERRDLGHGTDALSVMAEGTVALGKAFQLYGRLQTWSSVGVASDWLENEYIIELRYDSDAWISLSHLNLKIDHIQYNLEPYYRSDLGVLVLPWDNDTLIQAYMTIPWEI